jgi:polyisoprenyl-teichoic acid--peptidoglycan teichoic acid transferase
MTPTSGRPPSSGAKPSAGAAGAAGKPGGGAHAPGLSSDVSDGVAQAKALGPIGIPIYYPKLIPAGSQYCSEHSNLCPVEGGAGSGYYPRAYLLHDRQGISHYAYRMTLALNPVLGEYYGVQGTTWQNPPILQSPTATKVVGGKQLLLYANGGSLGLVAWRTPQGVYWISNTLTDTIGNSQMVAIAASLTRAGGN